MGLYVHVLYPALGIAQVTALFLNTMYLLMLASLCLYLFSTYMYVHQS